VGCFRHSPSPANAYPEHENLLDRIH
jgi:hypothetical protein